MRLPFAEIFVTAAFFAGIAIFSGCPVPAPIPDTSVPLPAMDMSTPGVFPACSIDGALPTSDNVCDGMFTPTGLACVKCPSTSGCIDPVDVVYCVVGTCLSDKNCALDDTTESSKKPKKSKVKRR